MQKHLIIFDDNIDLAPIGREAGSSGPHAVDLFPLTSDAAIVEKLKRFFACSGLSCSCVDSASLVNDEVASFKNDICRWSYALGEETVSGKKVKEFFLFDRNKVNSWWFSLISEKNTVKTDIYLKICQYRAIERLITKNAYVFVYAGTGDPRLRKAIMLFLKERGMNCKTVDLKFSVILKLTAHKLAKPAFFLKGVLTWLRFVHRYLLSKLVLGRIEIRLPGRDSLLWVNYFPAADKQAAESGIFINNYAPELQKKFQELRIPITWLFMFVPFDGFTYKRSLHLARRFVRKGENLFFLEEFATAIDIFKAFFIWVSQAIKSLIILPKLKKTFFRARPIGIGCSGFIEWLWAESFCGQSVIEGILDYFCYRNIFKKVPHLKACLYYCEMLAWEKALNAAKKEIAPQVKSIGFQHAIVPRNLFNYFYDSNEIKGGDPAGLPQPDIIACNGKIACSLLKEAGFDNLTAVEAARHTYIEKVLGKTYNKKRDKPVLLVAGSIDRNETVSLARLLHHAFPKTAPDFEIWLKSHPCLDFREIFHDIGIDPLQSGYKFCNGNVPDCFSQANTVLVSSSSVALEATAFGCEVIVPVFVDSMTMNPLLDFNFPCHLVKTPSELKRLMGKLATSDSNNTKVDRGIVKNYWELNSKLSEWEKLITSVYEPG